MYNLKQKTVALRVGSVVTLNIDDAIQMTVESIQGDKVDCVWFEGNTLFRDSFNKSELVFIK